MHISLICPPSLNLSWLNNRQPFFLLSFFPLFKIFKLPLKLVKCCSIVYPLCIVMDLANNLILNFIIYIGLQYLFLDIMRLLQKALLQLRLEIFIKLSIGVGQRVPFWYFFGRVFVLQAIEMGLKLFFFFASTA